MSLPVALRRFSLRSTLLGIILLALLPTLGITALSLVSAGKSQRDISIQQLLEGAHIVSQSTVSELEVMHRLLRVMSDANGGGGIGEDGLAAVAERIGGSHAIYHVRRNGDILNVNGAGIDPGIAQAVREAAREGDVHVTNFLMPASKQRPDRIALAIPIAKDSAGDRVAVIAAPSNRLIRGLSREAGSDTSVVLAITDGNGRIISRSIEGEAMMGRPVPDWDLLTAAGTDSGWFRARRLEGPEIIFAFQRIPGTPGWAAVVGEPVSTFDLRWQSPIIAMIIAAVVTATAALGLALVLAHRVLQPVKALAARAHHIAHSVDDPAGAVAVRPSFVAEFDALRRSLDGAETALRGSLAESRSAERALRENYATLTQAERVARIGSWSLDLASGEFASSPMLLQMNGYPPDARLRVSDLRRMVDAETYRRIESAIELCTRTGTPYGMEILHLRPDGRHFAAWLQGEAIRDEEGEVVRIAGIVQDISERKEQSALLTLLADNLPSGVIFRLGHNPGALPKIVYVSAGIERLTGLSPEAILADPVILLRAIEASDRRGLFRAFLGRRALGDVIDREFRLRARDGRVIWIHLRTGLRAAAGSRPMWDGIAIDVTVAREAATALRTAKEAAESAERAKSGFLATMSHELRTPMNTLIGMSRLALRTDLQPKQRDYLEKINAAANVLLELINDILDYSKIEAGRLELEGTVFRLEAMLDTVSSVNALRAEEKGLEITFSIAPDVPQVVRGDPLRLGQVLTNLVGNAVKFTEAGDVVVSVRPLQSARGVRLLFEVRDTGIGLTRDQIRGLFRPFTQAAADVSRRYGGTGLGLAICRQLVELMGGEIWVESKPGVGSSFYFTVTLEPVAEADAPPGLALPTGGLLGRRVLVVDDNASARIALAEMLESFGMGVRTAADGQGALRLLRQEALANAQFDIVLVDWRMPGMDGIELISRIAEIGDLPQMPAVLMVTAFGPSADLAEQPGLSGILHKPVTPSAMFNTIATVLSDGAPMLREASAAIEKILAGRRILVVDDNALNREVATDFLELAGAQVETAVDGRAAIERLERGHFDAVLMDVHMPVLSGLDAVREIRRNPKWAALPVIALTAQARVEDRAESLAAGMSGHLTKPIDEVDLYRVLQEAFGRPQPSPGAFVVDQGRLQDRFGGGTERLRRFVSGFLRDFGASDADAGRLAAEGDLSELAELAHRIKGTAGYFGADALVEQARLVESAARGRDLAAARALVPVLQQLAAECVAALREVAAGLGAAPGGPLSPAEAVALVDVLVPLVDLGEYAAMARLERLAAGLAGTQADAARAILADFEASELAQARDGLARLRAALLAGA